MAILGVEAGAVDEVDAAANYVSCGESGTIGLASPGGAEGMPIIAMVTIGMFIPTCGGKRAATAEERYLRGKQDRHKSSLRSELSPACHHLSRLWTGSGCAI